jgi:hypothetical protein
VLLFLFLSAHLVNAQGGPAPSIKYDRKGKPNWVEKPEGAFNPAYYICGVGSGSSQETADASAFASLIAYFGQSVESNIQSVQIYKERVTGNLAALESRDEISSEVKLTSSFNQLMGAKIVDRWKETVKKKTTYYAAAVMQKAEAVRIYTQLIGDNHALIEKLTAIPAAEKATIATVARYQCAADIADANGVFKNILLVLGASRQSDEGDRGIDYRLRAQDMASQIPIAITVKGDVDGRIKTALASVFTGYGFVSGEKGARYRIDAALTIAPGKPSAQFFFSNYTLSVNLFDAASKSTLLTFSRSDHQGHTSQSGAESRALNGAEDAIRQDYMSEFASYLKSAIK